MTIARVIRAILALQIAMAAVLFGHDLAQGWPSLSLAPKAPRLDDPVRPGDQTRRFRPEDWPHRPGTAQPGRSDMPERLTLLPVEEDDGTVLMLEGTIAPGDSDRLAETLERQEVTLARLDSPGGSVRDALAIGRHLRAAGIATEVPDGAICLSACPYVLAGGTTRRVSAGAAVGVHQHYFGENTALPAFLAVEDIQRGQAEVVGYLVEMGIDLRLMQPALATPPDEVYILVPDELHDFRLVSADPTG